MTGFPKKQKNLCIAIVFILFIVKAVLALSMQFIVTMPPVITKGTVAQFDVFGSGIGAQIFIIILDNSGDLSAHRGLVLRYKVDYYPQDGGVKKRLYEGLSNIFTMNPNEYVSPISSKDFLKKNNPAVKVSLKKTLYELSNSDPLKKQFLDSQKIPDGKVRYTMILEQNLSPIFKENSEHMIINTSKVELVAPGSAPSDFLVTLFDPHPIFMWTSDLPPNIYGNNDVFEIRIYKARSGESAAEAMSKLPVVREGIKTLQFKYPDHGHQLVSGATYYWEVIGIVKGISTSEIKSSPFAFRMAKPINPKVWEVINILKLVYGENIMEKIYEFDADVIIKQDGKPINVQELRELVQKIQTEEHSILSTTVESE